MTELEVRREQKRMLYTLKKLERDNKEVKINGLREAIIAQETEMDQEDIAFVEKKVADL